MKLSKIWTSNLKNGIFGGLFPVIDPFYNDSFYIGHGWGSSYSSMKLRKFSFGTGHEIQSVYIKNNVRCLRFEANQTDLFAVTNDKVIQLDRKTLDVKAKFEKGIQRYNDYIESNDKDTLLMMNYRMEFLFIYNHKTKEGRKKKIGSCCGLFRKSDNEYYGLVHNLEENRGQVCYNRELRLRLFELREQTRAKNTNKNDSDGQH